MLTYPTTIYKYINDDPSHASKAEYFTVRMFALVSTVPLSVHNNAENDALFKCVLL